MISIKGLDKAEVLHELWKNSHSQGMSAMFCKEELSLEQCKELVKGINPNIRDSGYFDYLAGRVMKIDLSTDEINPYLYDRDNYEGAAENVISKLRAKKE